MTMKKKTRELILNMLKGIVLATLLSFVIFALSAVFLVLIFYSDVPEGHRDFTPVYICMPFFYLIAFYIVYIRKSSEDGMPKVDAEKFDWKKDLKEYITGDGRFLLLLHGITAVIFTIGKEFPPNGENAGSPLAFAFCFPYGMAVAIPIPFLSDIITYVVVMVLLITVTVLQHKKEFKYWFSKRS